MEAGRTGYSFAGVDGRPVAENRLRRAGAEGRMPMKNHVGQAPGFLPYSDTANAGTGGKQRVITGRLGFVRAGAPSRFGLAFGSSGL